MSAFITKVLKSIKDLSSQKPKRSIERRPHLDFDNLEERMVMSASGLSGLHGISPSISYSLDHGNLYQSVNGGAKTLIDTHVKSFATPTLGNTKYLFDLNSSGTLKSRNGSSWVNQDSQVSSFALASLAGQQYLIDLNASGVLKSSIGGGWNTIDTEVKSFSVGSLLDTNYLFDLNSVGDLKETAGYGWSTQDTGVISFATGSLQGTNYIFELNNGGVLKASSGNGWTTEDTGIREFALSSLAGSNWVFELTQDNTLKGTSGLGWVVEDTNVLTFNLGSLDGVNYLWDLNTAGLLKASSGTGWINEDTGVRAFSLGSLGGINYVFDLTYNSVLKGSSGKGWINEDTNVQQFGFTNLAGFDYVFDLSGTTLRGSTGSGWKTQDTGVRSFAINSVYGVNYLCELSSTSALKYSNGGGWRVYSSTTPGAFNSLQTPMTNAAQVSVNAAVYTDIKQGAFDTCWIDASIAAVSAKGVDLSQLIKYQGNGWYTVSLWTRVNPQDPSAGFKPKTEWVYFDGSRTAADLYFDPSQPGESWTVIMQRALIQIFGQWDPGMTITAPHSGGAADVQPFLTGHASTGFAPTDANIAAEVIAALKSGKYVVMHTQPSGTQTLVSGHVYTVLSATAQNVTLYNPWGSPVTVSWNVIATDGLAFAVN